MKPTDLVIIIVTVTVCMMALMITGALLTRLKMGGMEKRVRAVFAIQYMVVGIFGLLALACVGAGIFALTQYHNAQTEMNILGATFKTGNVAVALVGVGMVIALFAVRKAVGNIVLQTRDEETD